MAIVARTCRAQWRRATLQPKTDRDLPPGLRCYAPLSAEVRLDWRRDTNQNADRQVAKAR